MTLIAEDQPPQFRARLASDEAAYITGQNIAIDGGLTAGWMEYELVAPANVQEGRWVDDL